MQLRHALDQISDIRASMARTLTFRGYRSWTTAFTGVVAICAASAQAAWIGNGRDELHRYLYIWFAAALLSLAVVGIEIVWRCWRSPHSLQRELSLAAVEQFFPSIVAGALLTYIIMREAPDVAWMLPGLWMILFSLGVFASRRVLPRQVFVVGAYYLLAGLTVLNLSRDIQLSPWLMGSVFGAGQLLAAVILYFTLERGHAGE